MGCWGLRLPTLKRRSMKYSMLKFLRKPPVSSINKITLAIDSLEKTGQHFFGRQDARNHKCQHHQQKAQRGPDKFPV